MYKTKKIILASASPRRKEILEKTGIKLGSRWIRQALMQFRDLGRS